MTISSKSAEEVLNPSNFISIAFMSSQDSISRTFKTQHDEILSEIRSLQTMLQGQAEFDFEMALRAYQRLNSIFACTYMSIAMELHVVCRHLAADQRTASRSLQLELEEQKVKAACTEFQKTYFSPSAIKQNSELFISELEKLISSMERAFSIVEQEFHPLLNTLV